jgi:hypothetical protein
MLLEHGVYAREVDVGGAVGELAVAKGQEESEKRETNKRSTGRGEGGE